MAVAAASPALPRPRAPGVAAQSRDRLAPRWPPALREAERRSREEEVEREREPGGDWHLFSGGSGDPDRTAPVVRSAGGVAAAPSPPTQ